jgi:hypothetical protein
MTEGRIHPLFSRKKRRDPGKLLRNMNNFVARATSCIPSKRDYLIYRVTPLRRVAQD